MYSSLYIEQMDLRLKMKSFDVPVISVSFSQNKCNRSMTRYPYYLTIEQNA